MRQINRLLAALLAVAVVVGAALLVVEVIAYRLNDKKPAIVQWRTAHAWSQHTTWAQGSVRVTCILLAVVGLILLSLQLKRRRPTRLATSGKSIDTAYTRRGVAATLKTAVSDVDGIRSTKVRVTRRKINVSAIAAATQPAAAEALRDPSTAAAQDRLSALDLQHSPSLSVRVKPRSA